MAVIYSVQILIFKLAKLAAKYNISEFRRPHWKNILAKLRFSSRNNERGMQKSHGNH